MSDCEVLCKNYIVCYNFSAERGFMTEQINCPFCGNLIASDALKCEKCDALFKEPELPNLKFKELAPFLAIDVLTLGFFSTIWFFINAKAINDLTSKPKDGIKLNWIVMLLALNGGFYLFMFYKHPTYLLIFSVLQCLLYIALSYRVLRIVQKYTQKTYDVALRFNPYYMVLFNVLYLVHVAETYSDRVFHTHEYFDWKSPQAIMLIILLLIILFIMRFYNEVYYLMH